MTTYDVCVIGSGAGGGAAAARLASHGKTVLVLEKGPWYGTDQFLRDEIVQVRRPIFYADKRKEPQVEASLDQGTVGAGKVGGAFWNGNIVGGASLFMSGFWTRMKPDDFRMRSIYGDVAGGQRADWPISYEDLEPYYAEVEQAIGVSGRAVPLPKTIAEPRSTAFPLPPMTEHPFAALVDRTAPRLGLHSIPLPRAVLPNDPKTKASAHHTQDGRDPCDYNGYCGSYACNTGAKGSSLAAWLPKARRQGAEVRARAMVARLVTDAQGGRITHAEYIDARGKRQIVKARAFVVACQAHESARLLLNSRSRAHPRGLANRSGQLGRNLIFSTFGAGWGDFVHDRIDPALRRALQATDQPFINRVVQDFYWYDPRAPRERNAGRGTPPGKGMLPGGTMNFLPAHPSPINAAETQSFGEYGQQAPLWGRALKQRLHYWFHEQTPLKFEVFGAWIPSPRAHVSIDPTVRDQWGLPVSRILAYSHPRSRDNAAFLVQQCMDFVRAMGASSPRPVPSFGGPSTNLIGGTCRMGEDPRTSVLNPDCRAWEVENLYVTDGSPFPSGGRVPFTATIYANALRVADGIAKAL